MEVSIRIIENELIKQHQAIVEMENDKTLALNSALNMQGEINAAREKGRRLKKRIG